MARNPFGKDSRVRILRNHFRGADNLSPQTAWQFVYQELLWTDGSTGLAHLYESDKAQPGRPWFKRTAVFTDLLCSYFGDISREELKQRIDKLFRACLLELVEAERTASTTSDIAETLTAIQETSPELLEPLPSSLDDQPVSRTPAYEPDIELVTDFAALLAQRLSLPQDEITKLAHELVAKARFYFTVERKRQNVLGEGFEDLLQLLLVNIGKIPNELIKLRKPVSELPGFSHASSRERNESPDIAIVRDNATDLLATVKWSLRHDRQKQLSDELDCYADLLSQPVFPRYILVTNEYDPGRLINTDGLNRRGQRIDCIYHVNLQLLFAVLADHSRVTDLEPLVAAGRLKSLEDLFFDLSHYVQ